MTYLSINDIELQGKVLEGKDRLIFKDNMGKLYEIIAVKDKELLENGVIADVGN